MSYEQLVSDEINDLKEISSLWKRSIYGSIKIVVSSRKTLEFKVSKLNENKIEIESVETDLDLNQEYSLFLNIKNEFYAFKSKILKNENKLLIIMPTKLLKINRRANFRLDIEDPDARLTWIDYIQKKVMVYNLIDVSLGGLSFQITPEELRLFKQGQKFSKVKVLLNNQDFEFDFVVKNILKYKNNYKVGVQFSKHYSQLNLNIVSNYIILNKSMLAKKYAS